MSEQAAQTTGIRSATRGMRTILIIAGVLVFLVGIQLFVRKPSVQNRAASRAPPTPTWIA